ncbi:efflux RND transporter periplasmic adaptor subunit [Longitalea arenae]|uniref:efflux RND transporter periplasmic adaptor subunit n=1 Tax=Longitalea arenae TaxID=2812558 RepID=UPI001F088284|nr:efflux RND transporter periplasmic adaptor subunit [Longitalea arenae]
MKSTYNIIGAVSLVLFLTACGASSGGDNKSLEKKKAKLEELKKEQAKLESEIAQLDTSAAKAEKPKLVVITPVNTTPFTHYIDLQGNVDTYSAVWVSPRGQGGQVRALYVKQGDNVRKGQLLMKLDDAVIRQQIAQANVQLNLAKTMYERRKNLWDQKIGAEIDVIKAKNDLESLEKQIDLLKEQQAMTNVYAEQSGVAERVTVRVGDMFTAATAAQIGIAIVNTNDLKIYAEVPEAYQTKVKEGTNLIVTLPEDNNKTLNTKVTVVGKTINPSNRSFYIESRISGKGGFRPGQVAMVRIQDYSVGNAITVPINTLQNDEKGKFVMVAATENGKKVAKKRPVSVGLLYGDKLEIKDGLKAGDQLITEGFQGLYDGQLITTA